MVSVFFLCPKSGAAGGGSLCGIFMFIFRHLKNQWKELKELEKN